MVFETETYSMWRVHKLRQKRQLRIVWSIVHVEYRYLRGMHCKSLHLTIFQWSIRNLLLRYRGVLCGVLTYAFLFWKVFANIKSRGSNRANAPEVRFLTCLCRYTQLGYFEPRSYLNLTVYCVVRIAFCEYRGSQRGVAKDSSLLWRAVSIDKRLPTFGRIAVPSPWRWSCVPGLFTCRRGVTSEKTLTFRIS